MKKWKWENTKGGGGRGGRGRGEGGDGGVKNIEQKEKASWQVEKLKKGKRG